MNQDYASKLEERTRELEQQNEQLRQEFEALKKKEQRVQKIGETLIGISNRLIKAIDVDQAIHDSLADLGQLSGADRAYLFLLTEDGKVMDNTHEWCAKGVKPNIKNLKNLPASSFPWWMERLHKGENIHIQDVSAMPEEAKIEKELLESQDIKSLLVLPVYAGNQLRGFTGFDDVSKTGEWSRENFTMLQAFLQILVHTFERRQNEKQLKEKSELLENITDNMSDLISLTDLEGNLMFVGKAHEALGFDVNSVLGTNIMTYVHPEYYSYAINEFYKLLHSEEEIHDIVHKNIAKDGSYLWLETLGRVLKDENGKPKQLLFSSRNITERKRAEEEILIKNKISNYFIQSDGNDFYKKVLDLVREIFSSDYGYFGYINNEGDLVSESLKNNVWNECKMDDKSIVFPKDSWAGLRGESLKKRKTLYQNENIQVPKGHVQLTSVLAAPIIANNKLIGQMALANKPGGYNDEDKKQLNGLCDYMAPLLHSKLKEEQYKQDLLEAKEKAEESDRLKSAFLANMSHEIRSPMNGIMGFSQLMQKNDYHRDKQKKFLDIIQSRGKQLLQIINDLLDVSKIEVGQLQLNNQYFNLNDVIDETYSVYLNELQNRKKTHIILKRSKGLDNNYSQIHTDPNRLKQVMDNLLSNAIKFTNEGSIEFGYELASEGNLLFYVKDSGMGIPNEQQAHVFDRFRQAEHSKQTFQEGTGLGLTISKNLVELMGGEMWVESKEEEGSAFYFTLPYEIISVEENNEENKHNQQTDESKGKTILIIEDDSTSLEYMKELLEPNGFRLILCETGEKGYEAFQNNADIDLILMDIKLPDTNGLELTRKIRSSSTNNTVPIIAQTAYAMDEDAQKSIEAGCEDHLNKPIDIQTLLSKIEKLL